MNRWLLLACVLAVAGIGAWLHHCNKNDRAAESYLSRAQTIAYDDPGSTVATKPPPPPRRNGAAVELGDAMVRTIRLRLSPAERVAAARWAIHENGRPLRPLKDGGTAGQLTEDTFALLQTVRGFADWHRRKDLRTDGDALRALGPHTAGNRPTTRHRRLVSRGLPADSLLRPSHWDDSDGDWSVYAGNWAAFRVGVAQAALYGFAAPCEVDPVAEGWPEDDHIAIGRGLTRLSCGERLHFWAPPSAVAFAAAEAAGGKSR